MALAEPSMVDETAGEARLMGKIVVIIALASVAGTAIEAALGALFAFSIGPPGTSGYIIEIVSWAIFMHLLIGMWARVSAASRPLGARDSQRRTCHPYRPLR